MFAYCITDPVTNELVTYLNVGKDPELAQTIAMALRPKFKGPMMIKVAKETADCVIMMDGNRREIISEYLKEHFGDQYHEKEWDLSKLDS